MITSQQDGMVTHFADLVKLVPAALAGAFEIWADGYFIGSCKPLSVGLGWACVLNSPVDSGLLTAPNREQVVGLALRTANQLCAKAAWENPL